MANRNIRGNYSHEVRLAQLSLCSQVLLLPLGVPCRRRHAPYKIFPKTAEFRGCSPSLIWGEGGCRQLVVRTGYSAIPQHFQAKLQPVPGVCSRAHVRLCPESPHHLPHNPCPCALRRDSKPALGGPKGVRSQTNGIPHRGGGGDLWDHIQTDLWDHAAFWGMKPTSGARSQPASACSGMFAATEAGPDGS